MNRTIPDVTFKTRVRDESIDGPNPFRWQDFSVREAFAGKKIVVFSLPGAFTPTCSNEQCPNYERLYDVFKAAGRRRCLLRVGQRCLRHVPVGQEAGPRRRSSCCPMASGDFTRRMGMLIDKDHLGFGMRSWRYAMIVEDNAITHWFEEPGINDAGTDSDPYGETAPEKLLAALTR